MVSKFIVKPINRKQARKLCERHPHARTLPNSSKYYFAAYLNGKIAGLAVWGYGTRPRNLVNKLFQNGVCDLRDYLELCRFFVYDWTPKNTASKFLSFTHKIIKKYAPWVKWLYTYAAGFQGLIGTIYQAANYDYIGKQKLDGFYYIPDIGLVHPIAVRNRYGWRGFNNFLTIYPNAKLWYGFNFQYIYWLRDKKRLMKYAKFDIQPYPTKDEIKVWLVDKNKNKEFVDLSFAKSISIVKLPTT